MSGGGPSTSGRRWDERAAVARQDSSAAEGPFSPAGLRVLVVDDDPMCLKVVSAMLQRCKYQVETQCSGQAALALLRSRQDEGVDQFDLVLSDVYMPDMDGFHLLEQIALELDLPVIMMSSNGDTGVVLRGVTHGAVDFLIKPVRIEELRNVWQHVVRRRSMQLPHGADDAAPDCDGDSRAQGVKRKGELEALRADHEGGGGSKKARVVWSVEMHQQFVNAVNVLGIDKAVPKRILDLMSVEGLTRENVASHLQKYRLYLKRVQGVSGLADGSPVPPMPMPAMADLSMSACDGDAGGNAGAAAPPPAPQPQQQQQQQQQHIARPAHPPLPTLQASHAQRAAAAAAAAAALAMGPGAAPVTMMGMAAPMAAWQQQAMAMQAAAAAAAGTMAGLPPPPHFMPPGYPPLMPPPAMEAMAYGAASGAAAAAHAQGLPFSGPPPYTAPRLPPSASAPSFASHGSALASTHHNAHSAGAATADGSGQSTCTPEASAQDGHVYCHDDESLLPDLGGSPGGGGGGAAGLLESSLGDTLLPDIDSLGKHDPDHGVDSFLDLFLLGEGPEGGDGGG